MKQRKCKLCDFRGSLAEIRSHRKKDHQAPNGLETETLEQLFNLRHHMHEQAQEVERAIQERLEKLNLTVRQ